MRAHDNLLLNRQLCFALYCATNAITRRYRRRLDGVNLTYPQYLVLIALWEEDGSTIKTLTHRLRLDTGTISPLLQRMEADGLLHKRRIEQDERVVRVFLSERAKSLMPKLSEIQQELVCETELGPADFDHLIAVLERLTTHLNALDSQPNTPT